MGWGYMPRGVEVQPPRGDAGLELMHYFLEIYKYELESRQYVRSEGT